MTTQANAARVVAGDSRAVLKSTDAALADLGTLFLSAVQATETITLPVSVSQKVFEIIHRNLGLTIEGRGATAETIRALRKIASTYPGLEIAMEGCLDGLPMGAAKQVERAIASTSSPA